MTCKRGDLIGIPFPYSDLTTKKRRPVLVLTFPDRHRDFVCLAVTSVPTIELAVVIDQKSMETGRLPMRSWIRCDKIFTLSEHIIAKNYGTVRDTALQDVMERVCEHLGCIRDFEGYENLNPSNSPG